MGKKFDKNEKLDPQKLSFLAFYLDINSDTFGNALQSGLKAKYSQEYSENITSSMPKWLAENIGNTKLLNKAVRNLDKFLDDNKNKKIQADITKFVAKTLGRDKFGDRITVDGALTVSTLLNNLKEDGETNTRTKGDGEKTT